MFDPGIRMSTAMPAPYMGNLVGCYPKERVIQLFPKTSRCSGAAELSTGTIR